MSYLRCPDCTKKGVTLRLRPHGEDHYGCRYCEWSAFVIGDSNLDHIELARLQVVNPGERVLT